MSEFKDEIYYRTERLKDNKKDTKKAVELFLREVILIVELFKHYSCLLAEAGNTAEKIIPVSYDLEEEINEELDKNKKYYFRMNDKMKELEKFIEPIC